MEWLTVKDTAKFLGIPQNTVYTWIRRRKNGEEIGPPFYEFGANAKRFKKEDLINYIEDSKVKEKKDLN